MAYDMHKYVNMGVKRSVRTSGMHKTFLKPQSIFKFEKKVFLKDPNLRSCILVHPGDMGCIIIFH